MDKPKQYITMKRILTVIAVCAMALSMNAQTYIEKLSRGVVAVPAEKGIFVSWRLLATDKPNTTFNLMRNGEVIASNLATVTNFTDAEGTKDARYAVQTLVNGAVEETSDEVAPWDKPYLSVPLIRPNGVETPDGNTCSYTPNDCSTADVDGDGEYEIILKWDPSNSHDNSHSGYSGNVYLDCYKMEGVLMWRIDLGKNIRAGAHYTQFMVYDLDGDGKAELVCKTAPGSKDGKGDFVTLAADDDEIKKADNNADYRAKSGHVLSGPEYLTVFNGKDGRAMNTIFYNPNRAFGVGGAPEYATQEWGDKGPGNRGERYLACVAFLGGAKENPSVVMCRGYYTRSYLWAVDYVGKKLKTRWLHASVSPQEWMVTDAKGKVVSKANNLKATAYGQGAHSIAVGDVDGDGCDEITYGSAAIDHDGKLLYSTGLGHGDAQHLADHDPDRPGLEYYMVHEAAPYGADLRDAKTGEILFHATDKQDTGRGLAADIDPNHRGSEMWCSASKTVYDVKGNVIKQTEGWTPQNFRIYWDGDLQDELVGNGGRNQAPGTWGEPQGQRGQRGQRGQGGFQRGQGGQGGPGQGGFQRGQGGQGNNMMQRFANMTPAQRDSLRQVFANMTPAQRDSVIRQFRQGGGQQQMQGGGQQQAPRLQAYYIAKWNGEGCEHVAINGKDLNEWGTSSSCNGTKSTPCLQADLFGDWREEIILYDASDRSHLNIFTTNIPSQYRVTTLMHDHVYRMGVVWQNVAYNQPPHLGYYLPDAVGK